MPPCSPTEPMLVVPTWSPRVATEPPRETAATTDAPYPPFVQWLLAGGVSGLVVGWLDGYWAATRTGLETLSVSGYRTTILLAILLAVVFATVASLLTWPVAVAVFRRDLPKRAGRLAARTWRRWRGRILLVTGASVAALFIWTEAVGFQWAAVDARLPLLMVIELAVFVGVRRGIKSWAEGAIATALFGLAGLVVIVLAGYADLPDGRSEALARLGGEAVVTDSLLDGSRSLLDGDGDGHPAGLCVEDCDCDDSDPNVRPGARDIVGNGIDEDCDGVDANSADAAEYKALLNPTAIPTESGSGPIRVRRQNASGSDVMDLEADDAPPNKQPNIVFIMIDTLRPDHLGMYGYRRPVSPNLDALAKRGVVFEQARAAGNQTRFSVPPILTGKYFTEIERTTGRWPAVRQREILIAERLQKLGYQTAAIHSLAYFKKWSGMAQGMETHDVKCAKGRTKRTSDCVTDHTLDWLDKVRDPTRPFFLWTYYGDPHAPYLRHLEIPNYGPRPKDVYDQEIQFTDMHFGRLIDGMRKRGLDTHNTVFIVTSDHGEGLDERVDHGHRYHGATLTDEVIRIPLVVAGPGLEPGRVETPVSLIDLAPTFMTLAGGAPVKEFRGVSLMPWLLGDEAPHGPSFFEKHKADALPQKGMVLWPYKVILVLPYHRLKIYDLEKDPGETVEIKKTLPPEEVRRLVGTLKYWMNDSLKPATPIAPAH